MERNRTSTMKSTWSNPSWEGDEDAKGRTYDVSFVEPVPASSAKTDEPKELLGKSPLKQAEQARAMRICADMLKDRLQDQGQITIHAASMWMRALVVGFEDALEGSGEVGHGHFC